MNIEYEDIKYLSLLFLAAEIGGTALDQGYAVDAASIHLSVFLKDILKSDMENPLTQDIRKLFNAFFTSKNIQQKLEFLQKQNESMLQQAQQMTKVKENIIVNSLNCSVLAPNVLISVENLIDQHNELQKQINKLSANDPKIQSELLKLQSQLNMKKQEMTDISNSVCMKCDTLTKEIYSEFEASKDHFFPGGWSALNNEIIGHTMTYRITNKNNEIIFKVYNTGTGLQNHAISELPSTKSVGYYPIYGFKIRTDCSKEVLKEFICQLVQQKIAPQVLEKIRRTTTKITEIDICESIYKLIDSNCSKLHGTKLSNAELEKHSKPIAPQRQGTCTPKSQKQMLQAIFLMEDNTDNIDIGIYKQLSAIYQFYLLSKHITSANLDENLTNIAGYKKTLQQAIANFMRMFNPEKKGQIQKSLTEEGIQLLKSRIGDWKKKLVSFTQTKNRVHTKHQAPKGDLGADADNHLVLKTIITAYNSVVSPQYKKANYKLDEQSFDNSLGALTLLLQLNPGPSDITVSQIIEDFCLFFCNATERLNINPTTDSKKQEKILQQLTTLLLRYKKVHPILTPRSAMMYLGFAYILDKLCDQGYYTQKNYNLSCIPIYAELMNAFLRHVDSNQFIKCKDPRFYLMLQNIKALYAQDKVKLQEQSNEERAELYYSKLVQTIVPTISNTEIALAEKSNWETSKYAFLKGEIISSEEDKNWHWNNDASKLCSKLMSYNSNILKTVQGVYFQCGDSLHYMDGRLNSHKIAPIDATSLKQWSDHVFSKRNERDEKLAHDVFKGFPDAAICDSFRILNQDELTGLHSIFPKDELKEPFLRFYQNEIKDHQIPSLLNNKDGIIFIDCGRNHNTQTDLFYVKDQGIINHLYIDKVSESFKLLQPIFSNKVTATLATNNELKQLNSLLGHTQIERCKPALIPIFELQYNIESFIHSCLKEVAVKSHGNEPYYVDNLYFDSTPRKPRCGILSNDMLDENLRFRVSSINLWPANFKQVNQKEYTNPKNVLNKMIWKKTSEYSKYNSNNIIFNRKTIENGRFDDSIDCSGKLILNSLSENERLLLKLQHLLLNRDFQTINGLDALWEEPIFRQNTDYQEVMSYVILHPHSLVHALKQPYNIWSALDRVFKRAKLADPEETNESWFILKLAAEISNYAQELQELEVLNLDKTSKERIHQWQQLVLTSINKKLISEQNEATLRDLHQLRLETLLHHTNNKQNIIESYYSSFLTPCQNTVQESELRALRYKTYKRHLNSPKALTAMIKTFASDVFSDNTKYNCEYPFLIGQDDTNSFMINLESGELIKNNQPVHHCYLPLEAFSPEYLDEFGKKNKAVEKTIAMISGASYTCYSWNEADQPYRLLQSKKSCYLQRKLNKDWFTLTAPSENMAKTMKFAHGAFKPCHPLLEQISYRVWINESNTSQWFITDKTTKNLCYQKTTTKIQEYWHDKWSDVDFDNHEIPAAFLNFEDPSYIRKLDSNTQEPSFHFERYGITIKQHTKNSTTNFLINEHEHIELQENSPLGFGLIIVNDDSQQKRLLLPIQPFYTTNTQDKIHYNWIPDQSNYLAQNARNHKMQVLGWDHYQSEHAISLALDKYGQPIPHSSYESIYLAYVYLARDEASRAFNILNNYYPKGTKEELELLWWIIEKLPAHADKQEHIHEHQLVNSGTIAVQTLAMFRILAIKDNHPALIDSLQSPSSLIDSDTKRYVDLQHEEFMKFINQDSFDKKFISTYVTYNNRRNNVPIDNRINNCVEKQILSYCHSVNQKDFLENKILEMRYNALILENKMPKQVAESAWSLQDSDSIDLFAFEPLSKIKDLRNFLKNIEDDYLNKCEEAKKTLTKILPSKILSEQHLFFSDIDRTLLTHYREKQNMQWKHCESLDKQISQDKINEVQKALQQDENKHSDRIKQILKNRNPDIFTEWGETQIIPTLENLLTNYSQLTTKDYEQYGIQSRDISDLQTNLKQIFTIKDAQIRLNSLQEGLENEKRQSTTETREKVVRAILSQNQSITKQTELFQYISSIDLRPENANMLKKFIENKQMKQAISYVMQLFMGGGKTKVLIPLLVNLLADGECLPIVVVPLMSLPQNFSDLWATSKKNFGQEPYLFHFDRNNYDHPKDLQRLYETLKINIDAKNYIITTPSSVHSLSLKYIELLNTKPNNTEEKKLRTQQLEWLTNCLNLFRSKGIALIDEVHESLNICKEWNYATGNQAPIDPDLIDLSLLMYEWFSKPLPFEKHHSFIQTLRYKIPIENLQDSLSMNCFVEELAKQIKKIYTLKDCQQPLLKNILSVNTLDFFKELPIEEYQEYFFNLNVNGKTKIDEQLKKSDPCMQKKWAVLKEQFSSLLPITLYNKLYKKYGPSQDRQQIPYAVDYRSNTNISGYEFSYFMITLNYTIQMMYQIGTSKAFFIDKLREMKMEMLLANQSEITRLKNQYASWFENIEQVTSHSLETLDLENDVLINMLHEKTRYHPELIAIETKKHLNKLTLETKIIRSNAINFVDMFSRAYGLSGTPVNYRSYHSKISMDFSNSFLIESKIFDILKTQEKATDGNNIQVISTEDPNIFLKEALFSDKPPCPRALIDFGARLLGVPSQKVAKLLATQLQQYQAKHIDNPKIKYVIYIEADLLCAWDIDNNKKYDGDVTDCKPEESFTYYDEEHVVGVDRPQPFNACGVITINKENGRESRWYQSCSRYRQFGEGQTLRTILNDEKMTMSELQVQLRKNETNALMQEHFNSSVAKIHNVFRNDLFGRILQETIPEKRDYLFQLSENFFIIQQNNTINIHQDPLQEQSTKTVLENYAEKYRTDWEKILTTLHTQEKTASVLISPDKFKQQPLASGFPLPNGHGSDSPEETVLDAEKTMKTLIKLQHKEINEIITNAVNICSSKQRFIESEQIVIKEKEKTREKETMKELAKMKENEKKDEFIKVDKDTRVTALKINTDWINELNREDFLIQPFLQSFEKTIHKDIEIKINNLKNIDNLSENDKNKNQTNALTNLQSLELSEDLYGSTNFFYTYKEQKDFYNAYIKPAFGILFRMVANKKVQAIVVCQEEIIALSKSLTTRDNNEYPKYWLTNISGEERTKKPILTEELEQTIQELIVQTQFVNGKINQLLDADNSLPIWIKKEPETKIQFLKEIAPSTGIMDIQLQLLQNKINPHTEHSLEKPSANDFIQQSLLSKKTIKSQDNICVDDKNQIDRNFIKF